MVVLLTELQRTVPWNKAGLSGGQIQESRVHEREKGVSYCQLCYMVIDRSFTLLINTQAVEGKRKSNTIYHQNYYHLYPVSMNLY